MDKMTEWRWINSARWTLLLAVIVGASACMGPEPEEGAESVEFEEPELIVEERTGDMPVGSWPTVDDFERVTGKQMPAYKESPILKKEEYYTAMDLPPVAERLPEQPLVIKPIHEVGKYGGSMRVLSDRAEIVNNRNFQSPAMVVTFDRDYKSLAPGLVHKWDISEDGTELILHFRRGLRWSDGHPFTTEDVVFSWEDIVLNKELTPNLPPHWRIHGAPMTLEALDDVTIRLTFAGPYPAMINMLVVPFGGQGMFYQCKHHMKQFHPKYVGLEKAEELAREAGYETWPQHFKVVQGSLQVGDINKLGCPTMTAFVLTEKDLETTTFKRNPYYWAVDPEGNQLPYVDEVKAYYIESKEVYKLKLLAGEVDFDMGLYTMAIEDIPSLRGNEERGNYRTLLWKSGWSGIARFSFNLTHRDPVKRELFNKFEFRKAMSLALNREQMNENVLFGRGVPTQASVLPDPRWSSYFEPEFRDAYIEYDPEEANRLLDELGLTERDKNGVRLMENGEPLTVILMDHWITGMRGAFFELAKEYWADVGLEMILKPVDPAYRVQRLVDGDFDLMVWHIDGVSDIRFVVRPFSFVPTERATCWGPMWYRWFDSDGVEGEEPPPEVKQLRQWVVEMGSTTDDAKRIAAGKNILRSQAENLWSIGTVGYYSTPLLASKRLGNVPEVAPWTWDHFHTAQLPPEAFYFKD